MLVALALVGVAAVAAPAQAKACTCQPTGVRAHAQQADAVFTGLATDSVRDTTGAGKRARDVRRTTVEVDRIYQGAVADSPVEITSPWRASDCGLGQLPPGEMWVFFVDGQGTAFTADRCGGSRAATNESLQVVEAALGAGEVIVEPVAEPPPLEFTDVETAAASPLGRLVAPGAAVTIIGLLGLMLVRARSDDEV